MSRKSSSSDVYSAIAEPRRRQIIDLLSRRRSLAVGAIVMTLGLPQPAVSKHLGVLREVGIVSVTKQGQQRVYALNHSQLRPVYDWVKTFEKFWEGQLDRIRERAEQRALRTVEYYRACNTQEGNQMTTSAQIQQSVEIIDIQREIDIAAPIEIAFAAMLDELGPDAQLMDGTSYPFRLEPWPGGRWYRDLGNNTGHLWGQVQVIKPPILLEISGPLMMSYPAVNHIQYRFTAQGSGTRLTFAHRAMGLILPDHREGTPKGWWHWMERIRDHAERNSTHHK